MSLLAGARMGRQILGHLRRGNREDRNLNRVYQRAFSWLSLVLPSRRLHDLEIHLPWDQCWGRGPCQHLEHIPTVRGLRMNTGNQAMITEKKLCSRQLPSMWRNTPDHNLHRAWQRRSPIGAQKTIPAHDVIAQGWSGESTTSIVHLLRKHRARQDQEEPRIP